MHTLTVDSETVFLDSEDVDVIRGFDWFIFDRRGTLLARAYRVHMSIYMHRLIPGANDVEKVVHRNGNTLDNRKNNLLIADSFGRVKKSHGVTGSSQYRGVSFEKKTQNWVAVFWDRTRNQSKRIGTFISEEDAALAYDEYAEKLLGKFARKNYEGGDA